MFIYIYFYIFSKTSRMWLHILVLLLERFGQKPSVTSREVDFFSRNICINPCGSYKVCLHGQKKIHLLTVGIRRGRLRGFPRCCE